MGELAENARLCAEAYDLYYRMTLDTSSAKKVFFEIKN